MRRETLFISAAALLYGSITAGGRFFLDEGLSLFETAFFRVLFIALILLPVVLARREYFIKRDKIPFYAVFGLIGAALVLAQFGGIALGAPVSVVALLLYTQPVWTIFLGKFILGEAITGRKILAAAVAIFGVLALFFSPGEDSTTASTAGVLTSLAGGVFLSLWVIWGRRSGIQNQHFITSAFGWTAFAALWMILLHLPITALIPDDGISRLTAGFPTDIWAGLGLFALVGGVIPHLLFYRGIRETSALTAGVILLLEPVSAALIAALWFGEPIGAGVVLGGSLILISNYIVLGGDSR